ncbi:MAG: beta-ketoacyl-[acyl-carrier-protein] synthase family protein [Egibacteraceae bacterium]
MKRVAITGIGAVTPLGNDAKTTWAGLIEGRSGVTRISTFDPEGFPVRIAGTVTDFELDPSYADESMRRHLSRSASFGLAAAAEALDSAGLADAYPPASRGVSVASSVGRPELQEVSDILEEYARTEGRRVPRQSPSSVLLRDQNVGALAISRYGDCQGPMVNISTACAGAVHAIGEGFRLVQEGDASMVVTGGYDALTTWMDVLGFALLGALTTEYEDEPERASRPFSADRAGFVIGEGSVMVVLEDLDGARGRGAPILAELAGYGSSMNAYRITDAPSDGKGPDAAMAAALRESGLDATDIHYIAGHGTGTAGNDLCETVAIKTVFGPHAYDLAISSTKSMAGHLTSGAGGLGLLATMGAVREHVVPPTINLETPDPKLDLDYVPNTARPMRVDAALVNAFAFGGTNAALVVRRSDPDDVEG